MRPLVFRCGTIPFLHARDRDSTVSCHKVFSGYTLQLRNRSRCSDLHSGQHHAAELYPVTEWIWISLKPWLILYVWIVSSLGCYCTNSGEHTPGCPAYCLHVAACGNGLSVLWVCQCCQHWISGTFERWISFFAAGVLPDQWACCSSSRGPPSARLSWMFGVAPLEGERTNRSRTTNSCTLDDSRLTTVPNLLGFFLSICCRLILYTVAMHRRYTNS